MGRNTAQFWTTVARHCFYLAVAATAAAGLLALFAPDNVLGLSAGLRRACEAVLALSVPIRAYVGKSAFPEVTLLYMSLTLLFAPLYFFAGFHAFRTRDGQVFVPIDQMQKRKGASLGDAVMGAGILTFISLPLLYFMLTVNPGLEAFSFMPISNSRYALAIFGWLYSGGIFALAGAACLNCIRAWLWLKAQFED